MLWWEKNTVLGEVCKTELFLVLFILPCYVIGRLGRINCPFGRFPQPLWKITQYLGLMAVQGNSCEITSFLLCDLLTFECECEVNPIMNSCWQFGGPYDFSRKSIILVGAILFEQILWMLSKFSHPFNAIKNLVILRCYWILSFHLFYAIPLNLPLKMMDGVVDPTCGRNRSFSYLLTFLPMVIKFLKLVQNVVWKWSGALA